MGTLRTALETTATPRNAQARMYHLSRRQNQSPLAPLWTDLSATARRGTARRGTARAARAAAATAVRTANDALGRCRRHQRRTHQRHLPRTQQRTRCVWVMAKARSAECTWAACSMGSQITPHRTARGCPRSTTFTSKVLQPRQCGLPGAAGAGAILTTAAVCSLPSKHWIYAKLFLETEL